MEGRVLKWELRVSGVTPLDLAAHVELLHVAFQGEALMAWIATPQGRPCKRWVFHVIETGEYVPGGYEFVGTATGTWRGQPYVVHVFRREEMLP